MPPRAPAWWQAVPGPWPVLLQPLAFLYGQAVMLRWSYARPYQSPVPVVCIGNLTVGGTGKTPLAIAAAEHFLDLGERPVFLTRGYGGTTEGPHVVEPKRDAAAAVGDEPLLLSRTAPTIVGRDRVAGAKAAIAQEASVLVMDDGFQNPSLAKDLAIVVVDGEAGIGNGRVLPAGPLRAPLAFQIEKADALVVVGAGDAARPIAAAMAQRGRPVLSARLSPKGDVSWLQEAPIVAFAGIGRPEKFFRTLEGVGADVRERIPFPDHHVVSESEAQRLLETAERHGAKLVTTEKDWIRLGTLEGALGELRDAARPLAVTLQLDDPAGFSALLEASLRRSR